MWQRLTHWFHVEPLLAVLLWGGIYPSAKLGLREIPILSFTCLRIVLAVGVCFLVSSSAPAWPLAPSLWPPLLRAGLAQTMFQLLLIASLRWTTAGNSAILLATAPLLTAVWMAVTRQVSLRRWQWAGLVVGLLGVGVVVQGSGSTVTGARLGGDLLAFGAAGAWAWYGLAIGPLVEALGPIRATGWAMAIAALCFIPLSLDEIFAQAWGNVSWAAWAGLLYGATAGMVLAMALWGRAIHRWGPHQTMLYVYLEPVSAVVIAAAVLGEALHLLQAVGALLTFVGVGLASSER